MTQQAVDRVIRLVERLGVATAICAALMWGAWRITTAQMESAGKLQEAFITQFADGQHQAINELQRIGNVLDVSTSHMRSLEEAVRNLDRTIDDAKKKPRGDGGALLPAWAAELAHANE